MSLPPLFLAYWNHLDLNTMKNTRKGAKELNLLCNYLLNLSLTGSSISLRTLFSATPYLLFNFWCTMYKLMIPEFVSWILDKLNECNEKTPRMRPVYNQSFKQNPEIK
jgi:hypothetical protein